MATDHTGFDLAFRKSETGREGHSGRHGVFAYSAQLVGTCGLIGGPGGSASAERIKAALPNWSVYAASVHLEGVVAVVTPKHPGSSPVTRARTIGSLAYSLDTSDTKHWCWVAVEGSEAAAGEHITGSEHHVATRDGAAPSDPTIEQFDPAKETFMLYL